MKKTKLTRSLLAACSIVALTAVMYGCEGGHSDAELADAESAAAADAKAAAEAAAAEAQAEADAAAMAAAEAQAEAEAKARAEEAARAEAEAAAREAEIAEEAAQAAAAAATKEAAAAAAAAAAEKAAAEARAKEAAEAAEAALKAADAAAKAAEAARKAQMAAEAGQRAAEDRAERLEDEQEAAEEKERLEEMAATAAKLYSGIAAQNGDPTTTAAGTALSAGERAAAYNNVDVPAAGTAVDTRIMVGIGTGTPVALTEDKETMVDAFHGWEGKRYTAEPLNDGMYEAMVYSNVEAPKMGDKFGQIGVTTAAAGYEYGLDADGAYVVDTTNAANQMLVASSMFDQSAGVKAFKKGDNEVAVMIPGMFHGVSGTYICTPAGVTICASLVVAGGFQLGTVASATDSTFTPGATGWNFKPSNPEARTVDVDVNYASYGWWIHKSEDGKTFTASAFHDFKGTAVAVDIANLVAGTATYMGGAAGKYALTSATGGTNDAGHFTARATLEADFGADTITGTIDQFHGADGMERDWSVDLREAAIADTGAITRTGANQANNDTVWTIGADAAQASGEWSGNLREEGADNVPKAATGTFYTEYGSPGDGTDGRMVGAFGANVVDE